MEATHPTVAKQVGSTISTMELSESPKNETGQVAKRLQVDVLEEQNLTRQVAVGDAPE